MTQRSRILVSTAALLASATLVQAQTFNAVERDDAIFGLNRNAAIETSQLVRGYPTGTRTSNEWAVNFMQSMEFDNVDGFRHNPQGNLLGTNFGVAATGGELYSLQTAAAAGVNPGAHTRIFDFASYNTANPGSTLTINRLAGLAVSPSNTQVALVGFESGNVYVFDYSAGNGTGNGNALTNGRQFNAVTSGGFTNGSAWLDNNNLLVTDNTGSLKKLDVSTGAVSTVAPLSQAATASFFSSVVYDPTVSPNAYVSLAGLSTTGGATVNQLYVVDPSSGTIVRSTRYDTSANTMRELSFNSRGDLVFGQFGNTASTPAGGSMEIITGAFNAASLADNVSSEYYVQATVLSAQFNGSDVASQMIDYVTPGVTADLRNRTHIQQYFGSSAPLNDLRLRIRTGYNNGSWNGVGGILSSNAAANPGFGIAYADAASLVPTPVTNGPSFILRYTRLGDANIDGIVNIGDFSRLASNFNQAGLWTAGDFNYDGQVNIGDFSLLASNFNLSAATGARGAVVPEPASAVLLLAAAGLVARRRR